MPITTDLLTNTAYGFPRGHVRSIVPKVLAVVHITANLGTAQNQRDYANRPFVPGTDHPTATYYIDRDGDGILAVDPKYAAWSNGDLKAPKTSNAGIAYLVALKANGRNANEGCYLEVECVGTATIAGQWTDAQFATVARLIADAAKVTGLPISETTVLPHAYINTIDRPHCPSLNVAVHMTRLIAEAKGEVDVTPAPITDETPKIVTTAANGTWYDLDGTTKLSTGHAALPPRTSPYGTAVPPRRAIFATVLGNRRTVLVIPATVAPVPVADCSQAVLDGKAAQHEADRTRAIALAGQL